MRIVHVILSRGFAGSERSTAESCNAQCAEHELLLVVRRSHASRSGLSILEHLDARVRVAAVPDRWFTRRRLARELAAFAPDVIHTHLRRATRLVTQIRPAAATIATLHLNVNGPQFLDLDGLICNAFWQKRDIPASYRGLVFKLENSLTPHRRLPLSMSPILQRYPATKRSRHGRMNNSRYLLLGQPANPRGSRSFEHAPTQRRNRRQNGRNDHEDIGRL